MKFDLQGNLRTSFKYWRRQLTFISAEETSRRLVNCLEQKKPGAYLRFGRADIDIALGIHVPAAELSESLVLEIRKAFLLSGENIFKSLQVDCPALDLPFKTRAGLISNREALYSLNAVGACFIESPIYSPSALTLNSLDRSDLLERFFELLKVCQPILFFKERDAKEAVLEKLAPRFSTSIAGEDIYKNIDWLEDETLRMSELSANGFPVVVLALGVAGRMLAKRLMKRGFPGFIMDLDNLQDVSFEAKPVAREFKLQWQPRAFHTQKRTVDSASAEKLPIRWEGPFLGHYSFSIINREMCSRSGANDKIELSIQPNDIPFSVDPFTPANLTGFRSIVERVGKPLLRPAEIHIGNHVHHPYRPPLEGRWVMILPWDYVSLPVRWVEWIRTQVDEVWVPSHFVRNAFLEAGIHQERVAVVPNGVDVRLYKPDARKVKLSTRKSFKFLFVGGPFWRKGFDILLEAYRKAFTAREDVSLIIKSVPEFWTSAGVKQLDDFRSRAEAPEVVTIVESLDQEFMAGLYATCNCLVHPYRAEGFAICVAEGMASGLPVIVTGVGGTTDYCDSGTAFLIPARQRQMNEKQIDDEPTLDYPTYAEPELDGLVEWMRYVYEHPRESKEKAHAGMNKIRSEFTWDHAVVTASVRLVALAAKPIQRSVSR